MVKIGIIGASISGNKGAESMYLSVVQNITRECPDSEFFLFSYLPNQDKILNTNSRVSICSGTPKTMVFVLFPLSLLYSICSFLHIPHHFLNRVKNFGRLAECDILIDIMGISFADGREKYLPFNILALIPSILMKKKILKYSQALGPFNNLFNRFCAKSILKRINHTFARGEITLDYLSKINIKNTSIAADAAFTMYLDDKDIRKADTFFSNNQISGKVVGISPSSVVDGYCRKNNIDYSRIIASLIDHITTGDDYSVLILPHSMRKNSSKSWNNDFLICSEIFEQVKRKDVCYLLSDELSAKELKAIIGKCDLFIASRFHAMVSALSMKVPTLVCGWSHKYREVLRMFDLEKNAFDYRDLNIETFIDKYGELKKDKDQILIKLEKNLPIVEESSYENVKMVRNLLKF